MKAVLGQLGWSSAEVQALLGKQRPSEKQQSEVLMNDFSPAEFLRREVFPG